MWKQCNFLVGIYSWHILLVNKNSNWEISECQNLTYYVFHNIIKIYVTKFYRFLTLVKNKLDYLIEEKKPSGHKNKSVIEDGFVCGKL